MIFDPALDDYIDYSLTSEADDRKRSNEATDGRLSSRDAIDSQAGSPSTFLESFDVAQDREGDRPVSLSPAGSHPSPMHLAAAYYTGATDSGLRKSIYDRSLSTDCSGPFAFPLIDEDNIFAPKVNSLDPYMFLPCKSQQALPRINDVLRHTAWSDETPDDSRLQRPTPIHTPYPLNDLVQNNENSPFQFSKKAEIAASDLPSCDSPNFREHPLYKDATIGSDQLYHCPWEGKADCNHVPTDAKCTYNKFVDTHLKPYRCKFNGCGQAHFASSTTLLRHEKEAHAMHGHGENPYLCPHEDCGRSIAGNGFTRRWNLRDHMRRIHKEDGQAREYTRANTGKRHRRRIRNKHGRLEERKVAPKAETLPERNTQTECSGWDHHRKSLEEIVQQLGTTDQEERSNLLVAAEDHIHSLKFIAPDAN